MKSPLGFLTLLAFLTAAHGGEPPPAADAHIIGEIPDGTPGPPAPPPPRLQVSDEDILASKTRHVGQRDITIQKLRPLELPDPFGKVPPESASSAPTGEVPESPDKPHENVMLGASVYLPDGDPDHARTFVQIWNASGRVSLWVNANFFYLTGFSEYETATCGYSLFLATSPGGNELLPDLTFPSATDASVILSEGRPKAEDLVPLQALIQIYNDPVQREKLKTAYFSRLREAARKEAELRADPPEKKPITLRYWRMDAAGQQGMQPTPADIR